MRTLLIALAMLMASVDVLPQGGDSTSAVLIEYEVRHAIKPALSGLLPTPTLEEYALIVKDDQVIVVETRITTGKRISYYDLPARNRYTCYLKDDMIQAAHHPTFSIPDAVVKQTRKDSVRVIEGYNCSAVDVWLAGEAHEMWVTDVFGAQFSPITDVPGVPLSLEKTDAHDGKLLLEAYDVRPIMVPEHFFQPEDFAIYSSDGAVTREVVSSPQPVPFITRRTIDGQKCFLRDSIGKVMLITFWDPESRMSHIDLHALNTLRNEFAKDDISFLAFNKLSQKRVEHALDGVAFNFTHMPASQSVFRDFDIRQTPTHLIVDTKGYIRYKYEGCVGAPLLKSMRRDLQTIVDPMAKAD